MTQLTLDDIQIQPSFGGKTYDPKLDHARLTGQLQRVFDCMQDGKYRTLAELKSIVGGSEAGLSARLRDLRKQAFGCHTVNKRRRGEATKGLWEYQLVVGQ